MKHTHRRLAGAVLAGALAVVTLAACSSDEPTSEDNVAAACTALAELDTTLDRASADMKSATTIGELRTIRDDVSNAYTKAESAMETVAADQAASLTTAWNTFADSVKAVGDDASLTDARTTFVTESQKLAQSRDAIQSELSCS